MFESLVLICYIIGLGDPSYKVREDSRIKLVTSKYKFEQIAILYHAKEIQADPEIRLTLKNVLWVKYREAKLKDLTDEYGDVAWYDEDVLKNSFEIDLRHAKP